jgi:hypothetical protein
LITSKWQFLICQVRSRFGHRLGEMLKEPERFEFDICTSSGRDLGGFWNGFSLCITTYYDVLWKRQNDQDGRWILSKVRITMYYEKGKMTGYKTIILMVCWRNSFDMSRFF